MFTKKIVIALLFASLFSLKSFSQFNSNWAFASNNSGVLTGTQLANVTIGNAIVGSIFTSNVSYGSGGVKCQPASGTDWPIVPTDGFSIDFPISPNGAVDLTLTGLTLSAKISGGSGVNVISLAYQADGVGAFIPFGTPQNTGSSSTTYTINFGTLNRKLYNGHSYLIRMYIYAVATGVTSSRSLSVKNASFSGTAAVALTQPTVTTTSANKTGKYTATVTGSVNVAAGNYSITESGIVWDVAANPTVALATKNNGGPIASGIINFANGGSIAGLKAGLTYHTRAYIISETGDAFYGADLPFTTDAPTIASLTTNDTTNVTSIKATSGGVIIDSGGVGITAKGVCWGTSTGPTIALPTKTIDGIGNASFSSLLKILTPTTTYYARAYATNAIGTAYGNEIIFTTHTPEPIITTTTSNGFDSLPYGNVIIKNVSNFQSYTLSASALSPLTGNITITAPSGFQISLSSGTGYSTTLNIPYVGGVIAATTIYVKFTPTQYGLYSGTITHSGGGAIAVNIDDVKVTGNGLQNPGDLTNVGTDFWTGFGYQSNMDSKPSSGSAAHISIFVATGNQASTVVVDLPNIIGATGFPQTFTIPANTVQEITGFPIGSIDQFNTGNTADTRLYYTGISERGIHIFSADGVPFSAWMYTYTTNNSAGASMLFPTNTWGSNYIVQSYGGHSNTANPNAFFYVIAKEDNTSFEFTPSQDIVDSSTATLFNDGHTASMVKYHQGIKYLITLNKGQIFNAMGYIDGSGTGTGSTKANGLDLSGTIIKSLDCAKKLAVFSGNGRVLVEPIVGGNNKGSDNLVQQMFPKAAWGTTYFTVPTKTMEMNYFRVYTENPTTNVWVNDKTHTNPLTTAQFNAQGGYYYFMSNQPNLIESDKPISVMQFITAGANSDPSIGNGGLGDPEMILLSSVQQSINNANVYAANFKNGNTGGSYINIIIKKEGIASFKIDGLAVADTGLSSYSTVGVPAIYGQGANITIPMTDIFSPHPYDANYYYAKIRVESGLPHTIKSDYPFNAIAYGMSDGESYGYNAGTNIKSLGDTLAVLNQNPFGNHHSDTTCLNNEFKYLLTLPYKPLYIKWDFLNTAQLPNYDSVLVTNPVPIDSAFANGAWSYKYTLPTIYKFNAIGNWDINVTVNASNADGCTGVEVYSHSIVVNPPPTAYFTVLFDGCPLDFVNYTDSSYDLKSSIVAWQWNFGGSFPPNTVNTQITPVVTYPSPGTYYPSLRVYNAIGCYKDTIIPLTILPAPVINTVTADNGGPDCFGRNITFTVNSTVSLGTIVKWFWEFSDGTKDTTTTNQDAHIFAPTTPGVTTYTVKVFVETSTGCYSDVKTINQTIYKVKADFTYVTPQCINTPVTFTDASLGEVSNATIDTKWKWNFGDAANSNSTSKSPTFTYPNASTPTFTVKLKTSLFNIGGNDFCADSITKQIVIQDKLSKPVVTVDVSATTSTSLTFNWAAVAGATSYQVSTNGGATWNTPSSGATGLTHVLTALTGNTLYSLCVKALGSCPSDSACSAGKTLAATVEVYVPNVFTPDATTSSINNKLVLCGNNISNIKFEVFSQWGEKIYETSSLNPVSGGCYAMWDGNAQGKLQPAGVYVYVATFTLNGTSVITKKGMVNLIR